MRTDAPPLSSRATAGKMHALGGVPIAMVKRSKPLPAPFGRTRTRLVHPDGAGLVLDRLGDPALLRTARWVRAKDRKRFEGFHARAPLTMQLLDDAVESYCDHLSVRSLTCALFGIGLVVGCHLRDRAENGEPITRSVGFDDALEQLDSAEVLGLLTQCEWPRDITHAFAITHQLVKVAPKLGDRLLLIFELAHSLPSLRRDAVLHFHFLLGMIGAGVGSPDPQWDHPTSWSFRLDAELETVIGDRAEEFEEYFSPLQCDLDEDFDERLHRDDF